MKKLVSIFLSLAMTISVLGAIPMTTAMAATSGTCGDNLTWTLDDEGTLTISGAGDMYDYEDGFNKPWFSCTIKKIIIEHGVTSIGFGAFMNENVESIEIANSVVNIGAEAFYQCYELKTINIPDSVESIGYDCFFNSNIENITLGSGVKYIGEWAFANANNLQRITVNPNNEYFSNDEFGTLFNKDKTVILKYPIGKTDTFYEIPQTVQEIANPAFRDAHYLTNIIIPDSVKIVSDYAFARCSMLENVQLPENVTSIGETAFYGCTSLKSITIPNSVTSIGNSAFSNCTSLTDVYYNGNEEQWNAINIGDFNTELTNATIHYNHSVDTPAKTYTVTFDLNGGIGSCPEQEVEDGDYATMPANPTKDGYSFAGWYTDKSYTIKWDFQTYVITDNRTLYAKWEAGPDIVANGTCGNSVTWELDKNGVFTISGEGAMTNYSPFGGIPWHSLKKNIVEVVIEPGVTSLGSTAFNQFVNLRNITIPDSVTSVGSYTFAYCPNLNTVVLPDSITSIADYAFYSCSGLNSITIPNKVTSIGVSTFYNCTNLSSVVIPDSVTSINGSAFSGCSALKDVYYGGTEEDWNDIIENNNSCFVNATIHFNFDVTTTKTISKVSKSGTTCMVQTSVYNVDVECSIIAAGYKNKEFVTAQIKPYTQSEETFTITDDIDEVKVMVWDSTLKPISSAEVIANNSWIYE